MNLSIDTIIQHVETWLVTGTLQTQMLADTFTFSSPFWQNADRDTFIKKFQNPSEYKRISLSNIINFDPIIRLKDADSCHFAIILQYHTKNGCSVWETVLGAVYNGQLAWLRSIYDLSETKKAHGLL